ncbi:MAG: proline dehydrogenase family protein [Phycisphaerales bacterium]
MSPNNSSTPLAPRPRRRQVALGSHNIRSIASALAHLESAGLPTEAIEVQMLTGMADPIKTALIQRRVRVREYVPVGQMIPGMAYLVRRLLENSSNQSWLKAGFVHGMADDLLLPRRRSPEAPDPGSNASPMLRNATPYPPPSKASATASRSSTNCCDFPITQQREAFAQAITKASPFHRQRRHGIADTGRDRTRRRSVCKLA